MFNILLGLIVIAAAILIFRNYFSKSEIIPNYGGQYTEGIIGQPRYINPVLAQTNDADRDIVQPIFSGLLKYDGKGNLIEDLAESYSIDQSGLIYDFKLKNDIYWHDGEKLTADDIVFTIQTIQDPEYKSPVRGNWQGVTVEKVDDSNVRFTLRNIYAPFLHNTVIGIIPKHIWQGISAQNFPLAEYNQAPIGSGPYRFKELKKNGSGKIEKINLIWNENYFGASNHRVNSQKKPFIQKINFIFYDNEAAAIEAYDKGSIDGLSRISVSSLAEFQKKNIDIYKIKQPRYYAVFFNQTKSKALSDKIVRQALNYATDKQKMVADILLGEANAVNSPLLEGSLGYTAEITTYDYSLDKAKDLLEQNSWKDADNDNIREKKIGSEIVKLEFTIVTVNQPQLVATIQQIKQDWESIGAKIDIQIVDPTAIQQDFIKPREYQALLFGEIYGADPDPFSFWHSSLKKDPGLNLALYNNKKTDKLLEEARQSLDQNIRAEKYKEFQKIVSDEAPAVFLYSPNFLYPMAKKIKGINIEMLALPSYRFSQIESWYIKTSRVEK